MPAEIQNHTPPRSATRGEPSPQTAPSIMVEPRHAAPSDLQHRFDPHEFTPEQRLMWLSQAMQFATICRGITRR